MFVFNVVVVGKHQFATVTSLVNVVNVISNVVVVLRCSDSSVAVRTVVDNEAIMVYESRALIVYDTVIVYESIIVYETLPCRRRRPGAVVVRRSRWTRVVSFRVGTFAMFFGRIIRVT